MLIYSETGKVIGKVEGETFKKTGIILKINNSIGLDRSIFEQLQNLKIKKIETKIKGTKNIYEIDLDKFGQLATEMNFGWGKQLFVGLAFWGKI